MTGFADKAQTELAKTDKPKSEKLGALVVEVKKMRKDLEDIQRKMAGISGLTEKQRKELETKDKKKLEALDEELKKLKALEDAAKKKLEAKSQEAFALMKGLNIGLDEKGWETGGGIGADDGAQGREAYKSGAPVFMGKNVNVRDDQSAASAIFEELGIPYTGGASGSTVDAIGGIVDSMLKENEPADKALAENDPRKASSEAEICMYILGMHSAGHHSLVEMLYAAKQYPQKFFTQLRDPITDYLEWQEKCSNFLAGNAPEKYQAKPGNPQLDQKALLAARYEAMQKACPENVIGHKESIDAFMSYCNKVVSK